MVQKAEIVDETKHQRQHPLIFAAVIIVLIIAVAVADVLVTVTNGKSDNNDSNELMFAMTVKDLCAPRHLKVLNEKLFVAEAGLGPLNMEATSTVCCVPSVLPCIPGVCFGNSGQVSVFGLDGSSGKTLLTGLFSMQPIGSLGRQVCGVHAVEFDENGNMFILIGLVLVNRTNLVTQDPELVFASVLQENDEPVTSSWVPLHKQEQLCWGGCC